MPSSSQAPTRPPSLLLRPDADVMTRARQLLLLVSTENRDVKTLRGVLYQLFAIKAESEASDPKEAFIRFIMPKIDFIYVNPKIIK